MTERKREEGSIVVAVVERRRRGGMWECSAQSATDPRRVFCRPETSSIANLKWCFAAEKGGEGRERSPDLTAAQTAGGGAVRGGAAGVASGGSSDVHKAQETTGILRLVLLLKGRSKNLLITP